MSARLPPFPGLHSKRLHLRPLKVTDVSQAYLDWFSTPGAAFIAGGQPQTLDSLRSFVAEKAARPDALLLGIFDHATGAHVGNIKYEPVDLERQEAVLGIFIGAPEWQGRGAGREAIEATADWLHDACGIAAIVLGVAVSNARARKAYEALGFRSAPSHNIPEHPEILPMRLDLPRI